MFTAYERAFTPPSSHGVAGRAVVVTPRLAVTAAIPSRRAARTAGPIGASVAKTVTGPPAAPGSGSGPRVQTSRRAPSCSGGQAAQAVSASPVSVSPGQDGIHPGGGAGRPVEVLGQQPGPPGTDVEGLEHPVTAYRAEVVGAQQRCLRRDHAPAGHRHDLAAGKRRTVTVELLG